MSMPRCDKCRACHRETTECQFPDPHKWRGDLGPPIPLDACMGSAGRPYIYWTSFQGVPCGIVYQIGYNADDDGHIIPSMPVYDCSCGRRLRGTGARDEHVARPPQPAMTMQMMLDKIRTGDVRVDVTEPQPRYVVIDKPVGKA